MNSTCRKRRLKAAWAAQEDEANDGGTSDSDNGNDEKNTPTRDCSHLWVVSDTLRCALSSRGCVPCAYKIATFDVALDYSFCQHVPNQRPEMCPRATTPNHRGDQNHSRDGSSARAVTSTTGEEAVLGYKSGMKVLTVGDGDFSFSLALARLGCNVTATSYETRDTVFCVYKTAGVEATLSELESSGCCCTAFSVDATKLRETLPNTSAAEGTDSIEEKFERIVWNFPCSAVAKGQDGQNQEMEKNKELVRSFVENARQFLVMNGQIHINHKTKPPFNQWKLEEIAMSAVENVYYLGRVVLDRSLFPPYVPRKALDRKSFPCHDACTYILCLRDGTTVMSQLATSTEILDPSTMLLKNVEEKLHSNHLVAVTPDLIMAMRGILQSIESVKKKRNTTTSRQRVEKKQR